MNNTYLIIGLIIALLSCSISISISISMTMGGKKGEVLTGSPFAPLLPGFHRSDFGPNNMSGKETAASCLKWAQDNKYPAYGYRNETHPGPEWRNTCFSYTKANAYPGNNDDTVHKMGCSDPSKSVLNGCV